MLTWLKRLKGPTVGEIPVRCINGDVFNVHVPEAANRESFFVFGLPKAGSTLLHNVMREACQAAKIPVISIAGDAFNAGVPFVKIGKDVEKVLFGRGYAYLDFRAFFCFEPHFDFSRYRKVLLVRDPRDMLVSLYFSLKKSHQIPQQGVLASKMKATREKLRDMDINTFVLNRASGVVRQFGRYRPLMGRNLKLYRYEDIIFDKSSWLRDMLDFLDVQLGVDEIHEIADRHDIRPDRENTGAHVRQVTPGNFRRHLSPECIEQLNELLSDILEEHGYSL